MASFFAQLLTALFGLFVISVAGISVACNITMSASFDLLFRATLGLLSQLISTCLDCMHHNYLIPHWVSYTVALTIVTHLLSPQLFGTLCIAAAVALQSLVQTFEALLNHRREHSERIATLQNRISDLEADAVLQEDFKKMLDDMTQERESDFRRYVERVDCFKTANKSLQKDLENVTQEKNSLLDSYGATQRRRLEESHKLELDRLRTQCEDQVAELEAIQSNVAFLRTQHDHDSAFASEASRQHQVTTSQLNDDMEVLRARNSALVEQTQQLSTVVCELEPHKATLDAVKRAIQRLSESSDTWTRLAVTVFVHGLAEQGVDLMELDIDPKQYDTYLAWTNVLVAGEMPATEPVSGLSARGTLFPLSNNFVARGSGSGSGGSSPRQGSFPAQTLDVPQEATQMVLSDLSNSTSDSTQLLASSNAVSTALCATQLDGSSDAEAQPSSRALRPSEKKGTDIFDASYASSFSSSGGSFDDNDATLVDFLDSAPDADDKVETTPKHAEKPLDPDEFFMLDAERATLSKTKKSNAAPCEFEEKHTSSGEFAGTGAPAQEQEYVETRPPFTFDVEMSPPEMSSPEIQTHYPPLLPARPSTNGPFSAFASRETQSTEPVDRNDFFRLAAEQTSSFAANAGTQRVGGFAPRDAGAYRSFAQYDDDGEDASPDDFFKLDRE
ncbi:hypothetical protein OPT61_g1686 [Boeremia exigua]|uniref:Uncharacterized protein n=1 Tax=Boeremia exigua TaxID=749465 RepID=A0ACC2IPF6_9PLEO|nr:hypothetical protein OPT61_g1686 [Boeremia exigua]